eukprot:5934748-Alexandrium_andersonii.AAC.1
MACTLPSTLLDGRCHEHANRKSTAMWYAGKTYNRVAGTRAPHQIELNRRSTRPFETITNMK